MHALPMTGDELAGWLRLAMAKGLSPTALRLLLDTFGLPDAVLGQPYASLVVIAGEAAARAALAAPGADFPAYVDTVGAWCEGPDNALVTLADPAYPPMLLTMPDPPPLLYVKGRIDRLHVPGIAVVGSRSATPQGIEDAERFARTFSAAGVVVVSGLALGIDGAAHRGALAGSAGTVAVIGTGADLVYPAAHHALAHQIVQSGAIMTEWPLGTPARSAHFPQRNRLIAGLVRGVLIVEAAMRSGSLITARLANEMGRDVFALPGSIHAPLSRGSHRMIKQGAKLVETPEEVLEELALNAATAVTAVTADQPEGSPQGAAPAGSSLAPDAQRLLDALGHAPATLEILAARTEMDDTTLQSMLLQLELAGHLTVLQGGRFIRAHHGQ